MSAGSKPPPTARILRNCVRLEVIKDIVDPARPDIPAQRRKSVGTGFFIGLPPPSHHPPGTLYILTCAHCVQQSHSDGVRVILPGLGREPLPASILFMSPDYDLAVLTVQLTKEQREHIAVLPTGDAHALEPGQQVIACGFPGAQAGIKITVGVMSGWEDGKIQHSSPINPGNSGGPLLVQLPSGAVVIVGVNSSGITKMQNVGYAVPISAWELLRDAALDPKRKGFVIRRPRLGFCYHPTVEQRGAHSDCDGCLEGVRVHFLFKGCPLAEAGVRVGDTLCAIHAPLGDAAKGWLPIDMRGDIRYGNALQKLPLKDLLKRIPFGQKIRLKYYRGGPKSSEACKEVAVLRSDCVTGAFRQDHAPLEGTRDYVRFMGLVVQMLRADHKRVQSLLPTFLRNPDELEAEALVITHVFPGSDVGEQETIYPGAIVESVNGVRVRTLAEYRAALASAAPDGVIEIVVKGGKAVVVLTAKVMAYEEKAGRTGFPGDPGVMGALREAARESVPLSAGGTPPCAIS